MDRIIKVEELKKYLESKDYDNETIDGFLVVMKPFYDFYDFMLETHKMDYDAVEEDSSKFSESVFPEYLEKMQSSESPLNFMLKISGEIMKRYAVKFDFTEAEKVKIALNKYMEIMFKDQMEG